MDAQSKASRDLAEALNNLRNHLDEIVADLMTLPLAYRSVCLPRTEELCARLEAVLCDAERTILVPNLADLPSPSNSAH